MEMADWALDANPELFELANGSEDYEAYHDTSVWLAGKIMSALDGAERVRPDEPPENPAVAVDGPATCRSPRASPSAPPTSSPDAPAGPDGPRPYQPDDSLSADRPVRER